MYLKRAKKNKKKKKEMNYEKEYKLKTDYHHLKYAHIKNKTTYACFFKIKV